MFGWTIRRIALILAGTLVVCAADASITLAQETGTVRGTVTMTEGAPVEGAQVVIAGTSIGTLTDDRGRYLFLNVPVGTRTVRVQMLGYGSQEAAVTVRAGATTRQDFTLEQVAIALREVTVTVGSRAAHTAADELPVPVDVFPEVEIAATQQLELAAALAQLAPSIHFPRQQIADLTSGVRPFQLRGLSPDHSLVLINGKRRHPTAVVHVFGSTHSGSSGVDMNAIPPMALRRMEVLRDGAAAQYGSDAIAGVVNLVLRDDVHAPEFQASLGQYVPDAWPNDGRRFDVSGSWGVALGERGTLNVTGMFTDRQPTQRAGPDPRDQLEEGDADVIDDYDGDGFTEVLEKRNPVPQPNHLWGDGTSRGGTVFWNLRYAIDEDGTEFYGFGGYSAREDVHSGFYRRALDGRNWPEIHPYGFLPTFDADTRDIALTTGFRGRLGEWTWDAAAQFGQNRLDNDIINSHNASLGPCLDEPCAPGPDGELGTGDDPGIPNQTDFYAGSLELNQYLATLDLTRLVDIGLPSPVNLALGASVVLDNYKVIPGEPASYMNGYHPNQHGGIAAVGAQVFSGYRPDQEADATRNNVGVYAELEGDLTDEVLLSTAARFERYSDFGSTVTGKLALRYQPHERLIVRSAASTGFRAPGLAQSYYAHTSTGFFTDEATGDRIGYELGEYPVHAPEARALGAEPLTEEKSRNLSAGLAVTPFDGFNITADVYRVDVDDQIILSGSLFGETVEALLADYNALAVKFMTNAIDARTTGLDLTARYSHLFGEDRLLETSVSYNRNEPEVRRVQVPDVINELRDQVFDEGDITFYEEGRPRDRVVATARYTHGDVGAMIGGRHYGPVTSLTDALNNTLYEYGAKTLVDAEMTYSFAEGLELAVGGENLFDVFPDKNPETNNIWFYGIFSYPTSSGFGFNGRYVYTRLRVRF